MNKKLIFPCSCILSLLFFLSACSANSNQTSIKINTTPSYNSSYVSSGNISSNDISSNNTSTNNDSRRTSSYNPSSSNIKPANNSKQAADNTKDNNSSKNSSSKNNNVINTTANRKKPLILQDILKSTKLQTPDNIIYFNNGHQKLFNKNDPAFQNIINLNSQRFQSKLGQLKSVTILDNILQSNNILVYCYDQTGYAAIYFPLNKNFDGKYELIQENNSNSTKHTYGQDFGFLSSADQLLSYLNK